MPSEKEKRSNRFADAEIEIEKPKSNPVEYYEHSTSGPTTTTEASGPSVKPKRSKVKRRMLFGLLVIVTVALVIGALNPDWVRDAVERLKLGTGIEKIPEVGD